MRLSNDEFRRKFWTPAVRRLIQNTLYANKTTKCLPCSIMKLAPYEPPNEPALPSERINISRPFENVGIDYFGPYRVRLSGETKVYGLIFSCMTTRAIHLEITSGLTADKTMLAIRRFISRRGCPVNILSDNARQFQLVKSVIERTWSSITFDEKLMEFVSDKGIKWVHTTERAPWMGSIYERLIGSVKYCLKRTLGHCIYEPEELQTIFCEVELVVNSRPITARSENELYEPLRPIDFLLPQGSNWPVQDVADIESNDPDFLLRKDREAAELIRMHQHAS